MVVHAQEEKNNQLSLYIGPASIARQDLIFSPFIHQGLSPLVFGLKYEKNKKIHQYVRLDYSGFSAGLETPYDYIYNGGVDTAYQHSFTFVALRYGNGRYSLADVRLLAIGTEKGLETTVIPAAGLELALIDPVPLPRALNLDALQDFRVWLRAEMGAFQPPPGAPAD